MSSGKDTKIFGGLGSISLHDLIQLLGMNRRTATLVLGRHGRKGKIYFKDGTIIHAFAGDVEGQEAFGELLTWQDADFIIEDGVPTLPKVTLSESAVGLMLSALAKLDEGSRDTPAVGVPIAHHAAPPPRPPTSGRVTPRVRRPVTGAVITVPEGPRERFPLAPVAAGLVLLGAAGAWWLVRPGSSPPATLAASGAGPSLTPPTTLPPAEPTASPEADAGAEAAGSTGSAADAAAETPAPPPTTAATPEPFGVLVASAEGTAEISVDGKRVSSGARRLAAGRHTVEVVRPSVVGVQREVVTLAPGETLRRDYADDDYGWLQVVVIPWAEVFVNGRSIGQTPMGKVKAALGEHEIALRHPEAGEKIEKVSIRKGETTLVRVTMQGGEGG